MKLDLSTRGGVAAPSKGPTLASSPRLATSRHLGASWVVTYFSRYPPSVGSCLASLSIALAAVAALGTPAHAGTDLDALRAAGHERAAAVIARRVAQRSPKMKLDPAQGARAARAALRHFARSPQLRALESVMPRSAVELIRAIDERDLPAREADAIADYLEQLVEALDFARLDNFDRNHSHVTGRRWREIDYSGENMTWRRQKAYWAPRGVGDFRTVAHIDAYMRRAARMRHFTRVYRPRGSMSRFRYRSTPPRRDRQKRPRRGARR
jgi:hypothetical protein